MNEFNDIKNIEKLYDSRARKTNAAQAAGQWKNEELIPNICNEICKKIELKKHHKVLEVGCGSGVLGDWIKNQCEFYTGFDISRLMLKKFIEESNSETNLVQSVTYSIPFSDNFFDIVIMNGVSMYIHDRKLLKKTFNEIKRVVEKNGIIFIGENIIPSGFYWEFTWFQNLTITKQSFAKPYIKFRRWLANKNSKFAGKWKLLHIDISPQFVKNHFKGCEILMNPSASRTIWQQKLGNKYKGNRRVDFVIKLKHS